ncbi:MAG TPA: hypothetical protein EYQ36_06465, partial [Sulfitobacter sp.]|nr:hypothetical protein [Sulfitobacter sp.]
MEFDLLARQVTEDALRKAIADSELDLEEERIAEFFREFPRGNVTFQQICRLRRAAFKSLEPHRWESKSRAFTRLIVKRVLKEKMIRRALHPRKKRLVGPGRVVALIGADGAGKSTLVDTLRAKFSWKLCVTVAYLGIPKRALVVRVLKKRHRRLRSWGLHKLSRVADDLRWLWIAHYRLRTARRAHRLAERGMIVFLDRYPQPEFSTMPEPMDGPRIQKLHGGRKTVFGTHEHRLYKKIPPATDTFVLKAPLDCLRSRKDDLAADKHRLKVDAVNALGSKLGRFDIDVTQPLENVSLEITRELWNRLSPSTAHSSSGRQHLSAHQPV